MNFIAVRTHGSSAELLFDDKPLDNAGKVKEWHIVATLTVIGGLIRLWNLKHLGLVHFDEGIYASSGLWSLSRVGFDGFDTRLSSYAQPGYPFVVGLFYRVFGASDIAAILVSILAGTLTIPAAAWLASRSAPPNPYMILGPGAGAATAAFLAFCGLHAAYSRMALADASYLLVWTLGLIAGQRFLENPRLRSAIGLGLAAGLAQMFQDSGWSIGAIVLLTALAGPIISKQERVRTRLAKTWGFGLIATVVFLLVVSPWILYADSCTRNAHLFTLSERGPGGFAAWFSNLERQVYQSDTLGGGLFWGHCGYLLAVVGIVLLNLPLSRSAWGWFGFGLLAFLGGLTMTNSYWIFGGMFLIIPLLVMKTSGSRMLVMAWIFMMIHAPYQGPDGRYWLPLELTCRIIIAISVSWIITVFISCDRVPKSMRPKLGTYQRLIPACFVILVLAFLPEVIQSTAARHAQAISLLAPSDSLRNATSQVAADLPKDVTQLSLLARSPAAFYLGGQVPFVVKHGLAELLPPASKTEWALVDMTQLRQEGELDLSTKRLLERWEIVAKYPTMLNLPTLLDVDPSAAKAGWSEAVDAPLWLLRPRTGTEG